MGGQMSLSEAGERSHKLMRMQALWGGAANGALVIFAIPYLLRLDASITQISIYVALTSLGPLIIGPVVIAHLRSSHQRRKWMLVCGVISRIFFIVPASALLFNNHRAAIAIGIFCIGALPTIVFGALWAPTPGIVLDQEHQAKVINARTRIASLGMLAANAVVGIGMIFLPFPYNFIFVFFLSGILGFGEIFVISKIQIPKRGESSVETFKESLKVKKILQERQFITFLIGMSLIVAASSIAGPLQAVYFIKERGLSDRWMGAWAMMLSTGVVLGSTIWKRVQEKVGTYAILSWTMPIAACYFLFIVISPNKEFILIATLFAGAMNAGVEVGAWTGLYRFGSEERRSMLINIYVGFALGIPFVAAFFIPALTNRFTLTEIFVVSFVIRFLAGLYFSIPRVYDLLKDEVPTNETSK
jgi:Na+/melibiose symporter-like transporter